MTPINLPDKEFKVPNKVHDKVHDKDIPEKLTISEVAGYVASIVGNKYGYWKMNRIEEKG